MKFEAMLWVLFLVSLATAIMSRKYRKYGLAGIGLAVVVIVTVILLPRKDETAPPAMTSVAAPHSKHIDFEQSHVQRLDQ